MLLEEDQLSTLYQNGSNYGFIDAVEGMVSSGSQIAF